MRVYAVGDVHGCLAQLSALLAKIEADASGFAGEIQPIFLGDYVDRGPDSKGVIDRLLAAREERDCRFIRGNHDQFMLDFLEQPALYRDWRDFGGRETLLSYGVVPPLFDNDRACEQARDALRTALPERHLKFLNDLEYSLEIGGYYFTHAGVRPGAPLDRQKPEDLLWIRDEFLLSDADFGKIVVHGHTPMEAPVSRFNRISVDTGAYATGRLSAAVLEGTTCNFLST
ncbi:MAG: serine/threonine protein phosphatase [Alphaproteobacteria bacterium]|nr:serine/threonine protein phosphatase [Alphaproteobacteria bacterium]MDE2495271.1 serine/threonine protein phosphatase [Alphaproteobacteria bacterium]